MTVLAKTSPSSRPRSVSLCSDAVVLTDGLAMWAKTVGSQPITLVYLHAKRPVRMKSSFFTLAGRFAYGGHAAAGLSDCHDPIVEGVRSLGNSVGVALSQPRVEGRSASTLGANQYKSMLLCKSCD